MLLAWMGILAPVRRWGGIPWFPIRRCRPAEASGGARDYPWCSCTNGRRRSEGRVEGVERVLDGVDVGHGDRLAEDDGDVGIAVVGRGGHEQPRTVVTATVDVGLDPAGEGGVGVVL